MQYRTIAAVMALAGSALAQRPENVTICDYYTTALLMNNTAANQYTLLHLLVNTAVIGNYTTPNVGVKVNGILNPGMYNGEMVNLLPYFDGALYSTVSDSDPNTAVAVNFLDGGGAAPLMMNMPATDASSAQYMLLTHLYSYFGVLLGCSMVGTADFPAYSGRGSQYQVHKFMDLSHNEVSYFIEQVGLSAASFGVADADVTAVGNSLNKVFNYRCSPPATVVPAQGAQLQSVCIADDCPLAPESTCSAYATAEEPLVANATLADGEGRNASSSMSSSMMASSSMAGAMTSTMMETSTGTAAATTASVTPYMGAAAALKAQVGAVLGGAAVLAFAL